MGIRVALVDDHACFVTAMKLALEQRAPDIDVVGVAHSGEQALEIVAESRPDLVLMDMAMPDQDGVETTRRIRTKWNHIKVLVLSGSDVSVDIVRAMQAGIQGYLLKDLDVDDLVNAIRTAHRGELVFSPSVGDILTRWVQTSPNDRLTENEVSVLRLIAQGRQNGELVASMAMSSSTVNRLVGSAIAKLEASTRAQAAAIAVRRGLI